MNKEINKVTTKALSKAYEAFNKAVEDEDYDPARWDIRFTTWLVDESFTTRLTRWEVESEVKE